MRDVQAMQEAQEKLASDIQRLSSKPQQSSVSDHSFVTLTMQRNVCAGATLMLTGALAFLAKQQRGIQNVQKVMIYKDMQQTEALNSATAELEKMINGSSAQQKM